MWSERGVFMTALPRSTAMPLPVTSCELCAQVNGVMIKKHNEENNNKDTALPHT